MLRMDARMPRAQDALERPTCTDRKSGSADSYLASAEASAMCTR
jgi:hypothetical protein